jgi:hypothetical protein
MAEREQGGSYTPPPGYVGSVKDPEWRRHNLGGAWRQHVLTRALYLEHEAELLLLDGERDRIARVCGLVSLHVQIARGSARSIVPFRGGLECAWSNIHAAELLLLRVADAEQVKGWSSSVLELAKKRLHVNDCRLIKLQEICEKSDSHRCEDLRYAMMAALVGSYTAVNRWYSRVRGVRNILIIATVVAAVLVFLLGLWGHETPEVLSLCFGAEREGLVCPHDSLTRDQGSPERPTTNDMQAEPDRADVILVLAFGFMGALISVIPTLARLHRSPVPYGLRLAAAALKLPAGALSAFIGITFIRGEFVPGLTQLDTGAQILAWSVVFGVSQYAITRLVDNKTWEIAADQRGNPEADDDSRSRGSADVEARPQSVG